MGLDKLTFFIPCHYSWIAHFGCLVHIRAHALCSKPRTVELKAKSFINSLTAHNWQKLKEYSWHVPDMKFIGMKKLV